MKRCRLFLLVTTLCLSLVQLTLAQTSGETASALPRLVRFGGAVKDLNGSPLAGVAGITFALYSEQTGGAPLWLETQNVTADSNGRYTAVLGGTKPDGLPAELFTSERAHWVGVQVQGQPEQPRVLLVSAPYALKAGDAETIGGLPPSAFVLAAPSTVSGASPSMATPATAAAPADAPTAVTGSGKADYIPLWSTNTKLGSSVLFQSGTGATAAVGINTATPASTLDVNGGGTVRGTLSLPATGTATASAGNDSEPLNLAASVFNSGISAAVAQTFQLQAEPVGNDTAAASGALSLLYGSGSSAPAETGLKISSNGVIRFAAGQTFPGAGDITGVTAGTDLTGGGTTGTVTLNIDTTKVPQLAAANTFTASQTVNGSVSASGQFVSTAATGTAPLQVTSTTQVAHLNASLLGGLAATSFQLAGSYATLGANTFSGNQSITGNVAATGAVISGTGSTFGGLTLPAVAAATSSEGQVSHSLSLTASSYDSTTRAAVNQNFNWQAEPVGNDTSDPGASLNLLFNSGTNSPAETGLKLASNGQITFATGQTFPGAGGGTVTSVGSGAGLTGGPITGSGSLSIATGGVSNAMLANPSLTVTAGTDLTGGGAVTLGNSTTLSLDTTKVPLLAAANTFAANQTVNGTLTATSSSGVVINSTSTNASYAAVGGTGIGYGVAGLAESTSGTGVAGYSTATTGSTIGVFGQTGSTAGIGVEGSSPYVGVWGISNNSTGVVGEGLITGVQGFANGHSALGLDLSNYYSGVWGDTGGPPSDSYPGSTASGVLGTAGDNYAGYFLNVGNSVETLFVGNDSYIGGEVLTTYVGSSQTYAVIGDPGCNIGFIALQLGQGGMSGCSNYTLAGGNNGHTYMNATTGAAVHLRVNSVDELVVTSGNTDILGTLTKPAGSFKIDHPLDPANKYLYHSFVESPDMKNMYDGNVTTDEAGLATVTLPDWFETLNRDFRYQLTVIGQFAQAIVASEIAGNQFSIRTDKPNVKVSWQVTGTRQDAFANAHRIQVEVEKAPADRGHYLYPELVGAPETARIGYMAPAPGSEQVVHHRPAILRGNASPLQRQPSSIPLPPMPVAPKVASLPLPAAQAGKLEVNQK